MGVGRGVHSNSLALGTKIATDSIKSGGYLSLVPTSFEYPNDMGFPLFEGYALLIKLPLGYPTVIHTVESGCVSVAC